MLFRLKIETTIKWYWFRSEIKDWSSESFINWIFTLEWIISSSSIRIIGKLNKSSVRLESTRVKWVEWIFHIEDKMDYSESELIIHSK